MLTELQKKAFIESLKAYNSKYLIKKHEGLDESGTRIMINNLLSDVLGYTELVEIKTEHRIKNQYADYVIQLEEKDKKATKIKQHIVIEVKAISLSLSESHIKQAKGYAADEGIDWVLLTNGQQFNLYRVIFEKPLQIKEVISIDLKNDPLAKSAEELMYLTKKSVSRGHLDKYWEMHQATTPNNLAKYLYKEEMITCLRRMIKRENGINFSDDEIFDSIHQVIINAIAVKKPSKMLK